MITEPMIQQLLVQAKEGRGLWLGLFLPQGTDDRLSAVKHPLRHVLPSESHITLAHLGKKRTEATVRVACLVANDMQAHFPMSIELTGVGCFWRKDFKNSRQSSSQTPVALVNSAKLFDLRMAMITQLRQRGEPFSDRFGFIPHITLLASSVMDMMSTHDVHASMVTAPPLMLDVPTLHVVCGDAIISVL